MSLNAPEPPSFKAKILYYVLSKKHPKDLDTILFETYVEKDNRLRHVRERRIEGWLADLMREGRVARVECSDGTVKYLRVR